jgi:Holliday junction DNA helicase RuvB
MGRQQREGVLRPSPEDGEAVLDASLRPQSFAEFVGQHQVKSNLQLYIQAARERDDVLDHILLSGMAGMGKTTLAHIVAREMGRQIRATSGPVLERVRDLAGVLTSLEAGDVLFIDEIHRLNRTVEEYLYSAMEDFRIDIVLSEGASAESVRIPLRPFTLVGATTRQGLLSHPFRARFGVLEKLEPYTPGDLQQILIRSAGILGVSIEPGAAALLAHRSRGTPRIANRFLRRVRDLAQVESDNVIDERVAREGLSRLGVDGEGLDAMDRLILECLIRHGGRPVGLKTLAVAVGEEEITIEEVYEPYLIQEGFLSRTPRGRVALEKARDHLGGPPPDGVSGSLFPMENQGLR